MLTYTHLEQVLQILVLYHDSLTEARGEQAFQVLIRTPFLFGYY